MNTISLVGVMCAMLLVLDATQTENSRSKISFFWNWNVENKCPYVKLKYIKCPFEMCFTSIYLILDLQIVCLKKRSNHTKKCSKCLTRLFPFIESINKVSQTFLFKKIYFKDGDGTISTKELGAVLRSLGFYKMHWTFNLNSIKSHTMNEMYKIKKVWIRVKMKLMRWLRKLIEITQELLISGLLHPE